VTGRCGSDIARWGVTRQTVTVKFGSFKRHDRFGAAIPSLNGREPTIIPCKRLPESRRWIFSPSLLSTKCKYAEPPGSV
jgi:hypothetical protein